MQNVTKQGTLNVVVEWNLYSRGKAEEKYIRTREHLNLLLYNIY